MLPSIIQAEIIPYLKENAGRRNWMEQAQLDVFAHKRVDKLPLLLHVNDGPFVSTLPELTPKQTHYDSELNFVAGLKGILAAVAGNAGAVPSLRANMGCGIYAAPFGLKQQLYDDKMPWLSEHLTLDQVSAMTKDDLTLDGEFTVGLDHMRYAVELLHDTGCYVFPMDLQGPIDLGHLVIGDQFFYDLYDYPEEIHHLLELCSEALIMGHQACLDVLPSYYPGVPHYNTFLLPKNSGVKTSEDTTTLLSQGHIDEFATPWLSKVLLSFGGGYVHYCGKNKHLFNAAIALPKSVGLNFGNPDMHDMEEVLRACSAHDKVYNGGIPMRPGESYDEFFGRILTASWDGDHHHLLLTFGCKMAEREKVLDAWNEAQQKVQKG